MTTGLIRRLREKTSEYSPWDDAADELEKVVRQITALEVVVPSELEGEERWNCNGQYVLRDAVLALIDGRETEKT